MTKYSFTVEKEMVQEYLNSKAGYKYLAENMGKGICL